MSTRQRPAFELYYTGRDGKGMVPIVEKAEDDTLDDMRPLERMMLLAQLRYVVAKLEELGPYGVPWATTKRHTEPVDATQPVLVGDDWGVR